MNPRLVAAWILALLAVAASAETAGALLARVPSPPAIACGEETEAERRYRDELQAVTRDIRRATAATHREQKAHAKERAAAIREQMMRQAGLTPEQIEKIKAAQKKGRKAGAAAKRELAEQVLEQQTDLTLDEARALQVPDKNPGDARSEADLTDPTTRAWATQEMAVAQATAQARTPEQQAEEDRKRAELGDLATLAAEQKKLLDATMAGREVVWDKIHALEHEADENRAATIDPLLAQLESCKARIRVVSDRMAERNNQAARTGETEEAAKQRIAANAADQRQCDEIRADCEKIEEAITLAFGQHCARFTPAYAALLREYLDWARGAQPGLERYEEMENEKMKLQTGSPDLALIRARGGLGLQEAKACVDLLASLFRYADDYRSWKRATAKSTDGAEP